LLTSRPRSRLAVKPRQISKTHRNLNAPICESCQQPDERLEVASAGLPHIPANFPRSIKLPAPLFKKTESNLFKAHHPSSSQKSLHPSSAQKTTRLK
jgi:hypothetical protein